MNKKFLSAILFGAMLTASTGTFVSCKDYDDDIEGLQEQVDANKSTIGTLQTQLASLDAAAKTAQSTADAAKAAAAEAKAAAAAAQTTGDAAAAAAAEAKALAEEAKAAAAQAKIDAIAEATAQVEAVKAWVEAKGYATQEEVNAALATLGGKIEGIESGLSNIWVYINETLTGADQQALMSIMALQEELALQQDAIEKLEASVGILDNSDLQEQINKVNQTIEEYYLELQGMNAEVANALSTYMADMDKVIAGVEENHAADFETLSIAISNLSNLIGDTESNFNTKLEEVWLAIEKNQEYYTQLNNVVNSVNANINILHVLCNELRSLVFVPELYVDGIEATEYTFALGTYMRCAPTESDDEITGFDDKNTPYALGKNEIYGYVSDIMDWEFNPVWTVNYHLNPSSAKISAEDLSFISKDVQSISSRSANASTAAPEVVGASSKDGILTVSYKANGAAITVEENMVAMMALQAVVKSGEKDTTITSDYAALYPSQVSPYMISYSKKNIATEYACEDNEDFYHIYPTVMEAIENDATLSVEYNGSLDLKEYLCIHYNQSNNILGLNNSNSAGMHKVWAYGEEAQYDLEYKYSLVSYTVGNANTAENKYAVVAANGVVEPRYVDAQGNQHASNGTTGVSSVGKKPVVRVEVVDKNTGKVVLGGFVKIEIVRSIAPVVVEPGFDLGNLAYACGLMNRSLTWEQMSGGLLEATAKTSKAEFEQIYELDKQYANDVFVSDFFSAEFYAVTYVKTSNNEFVRLDSKEAEAMYPELKNVDTSDEKLMYFGYVHEYGNVQGVANDYLIWATDQAMRDHIYRLENPLTLYVSYVPREEVGEGTAPRIFVPLTTEVIYPIATYGKKIPEYWTADESTQRVNVAEPKDNGNIKNYTVDLDNAFHGNAIQFTLTNNVDNEYDGKKVFDGNWASKGYIAYDYFFSWDNHDKAIGNSGYTYYLEGKKATNPYPTKLYAKKGTSAPALIATLDEEGNVQYAGATAEDANTVAKLLLNAWTHDDAQYAYSPVVGIKAYSAECEILLDDTYAFNARFLRPIDVTGVADAKFVDADDNGSVVDIMDLFNFVDWRDKNFLTSDNKNVWYFGYYNISNITVDIANITTTLGGGKLGETKLTAISSQVKFTQIGGGNVDFTSYNAAELGTVATRKAIKEALGQIKYENNGNVVADFQVRIPVKVTYEWGTINTYVDCTVDNTLGN